jgi:hypothetical protein
MRLLPRLNPLAAPWGLWRSFNFTPSIITVKPRPAGMRLQAVQPKGFIVRRLGKIEAVFADGDRLQVLDIRWGRTGYIADLAGRDIKPEGR